MASLKTIETDNNAAAFLNKIEDKQKREDCLAIDKMMQQATSLPAKMWGTAIVGYGSYHYKYKSGHEGYMCIIGFSPRKQNITLYVGASNNNIQQLLPNLGKHKTGKGCLYINKLTDVDEAVLKKIIVTAYKNGCSQH